MSETVAIDSRVHIDLSGFSEAFQETLQLLNRVDDNLSTTDNDVFGIIQEGQRIIHDFDSQLNDGSVNLLSCREFLSQIHRQVHKIDMRVSEIPNVTRDTARVKNMVTQLKLDCGAIEAQVSTILTENQNLKTENARMVQALTEIAGVDLKSKNLYGASIMSLPDIVPGRYEDWNEISIAVADKIREFTKIYPGAAIHGMSISAHMYRDIKFAYPPRGGNRYCNIPKADIQSVVNMIQNQISVSEIVKNRMPYLWRHLHKPVVVSRFSERDILALPKTTEFHGWLLTKGLAPGGFVNALARICSLTGFTPDDIDADTIDRKYLTYQARQAIKKYREFCESIILAMPKITEFHDWLITKGITPGVIINALARICSLTGFKPDDIRVDAIDRKYLTYQARQAIKKYREFCELI